MDSKVFNIAQLAEDIKKLVLLIYEGRGVFVKISERVKRDINHYKKLKECLEMDLNCPEVLKQLLTTLVTQSWYYKISDGEMNELSGLVDEYGVEGLVNGEGKRRLLDLVNAILKKRIRDPSRIIKKLEILLDELKASNLQKWSEDLYGLALDDRTKILGTKGRDNYLRDIGYWDRIPMDRHEMRFIVRTGIFHACSSEGKNDPLKREHLQEALSEFCRRYLKGFIIDEIDLGDSPGILDVFIWWYCSREGLNICGDQPKCDECLLRNSCLYSLIRE